MQFNAIHNLNCLELVILTSKDRVPQHNNANPAGKYPVYHVHTIGNVISA